MTVSEIAPELRPKIQRMPRIPVANAWGRSLLRNAAKLFLRNRSYEGVRLEERKTAEGVSLYVYTPDSGLTGAALLWIHGGGMVIGSAAQDDQFCAETARELEIVIVSTEYRLAPEHPFPAALDDCWVAWNWLQESSLSLGIDKTRIAVGCESAGGGLAASLVQRIHDAGGVQPTAQWLFCPMLDDRTAARYELDALNHKVWDNRQNRFSWQAYLGAEPGADPLPDYAAPARRQDLHDLPPAWIGTGDIELFFGEDRTYADRLNTAGVACTLDVVPGAPHGFQSIARDTQLAQDYVSRARDWLRHITDRQVNRT